VTDLPPLPPFDEIGRRLTAWFDANHRLLPWRVPPERQAGGFPPDPYRVWVSEVMLQQTRVDTVIPYFLRWMDLFPDVRSLAESGEEAVLKAWEGLGYYSRALNLHRGARLLVERHGGRLPDDPAALRGIPGVGAYIAAAVSSIAFGRREGVVDGNVIRVFTRLLADGSDPARPELHRRIKARVEESHGEHPPGWVNQAWMELGALVCRPRPACPSCPLAGICRAHALGREGGFPAKTPRPGPPVRRGLLVLTVSPPPAGTDPPDPPDLPGGVGRWVRDQERQVLLVRRGSRGLLGGLWELPNWEFAGDPPDPQAFCRERGLRLLRDTGLEVRHRYSHFEIRFRLLLGEMPLAASDNPALSAWTERRWTAFRDLAAPPRPRVHILAMARLGLLPGR
jgi:A/G-specific adenine glycosylase